MEFGSVGNGLWISLFQNFAFGSASGIDNLTIGLGSLAVHLGN